MTLWFTVVVFTALVALLAVARRFVVVTVTGRSMQPTLDDGDRVLVRRCRTARRGRLVVIAGPRRSVLPDQPRGWLVKRAFAVPGDPVPRVAVPQLWHEPGDRVPPGRLVVLGDNLAESLDSRAFGYVEPGDLLGVVVRVLPTR